MFWFMVALMLLGAFFLIGCAFYGMKKMRNNPLEIYVHRTLFAAAGAVIFSASALIANNEKASLVLYSMYNIYEMLTVMSMLNFVRRYIGKTNGLGSFRMPAFIAAGIDSLLMILNIFVPVMYRIEPLFTQHIGNFIHISETLPLYFFHLIFLLAMSAYSVILLLHRIITASKAYIMKYTIILASIAASSVVSTLAVIMNFKFDYSILMHMVIGFFMFYFAMIYVPRGLTERLMFFTVANMKDGIICVDIDHKIVYSNHTARNFCEADVDVLTLEKQVRNWQLEHLDPSNPIQIWETKRRISGELHYFNIEYRRIYDSASKYLGCFFLIHDRTEEFMKYNAERYRATHDKLTGLYNKEYFYDVVRAVLNKNPDKKYNIIVADVKNFKFVNDVFGVETGDRLLKEISRITADFGGKNCIYARLMGDRFAVFMPRNIFSEDKLLKKFSVVDNFIEQSKFKIHIHIGVYEIADTNLRISVMCDRANLAIKTIKDSFKSHVAYYESQLRDDFIGYNRIISDFETAVADGQFCPYIQPQIAVDGSIRGGEALVRWIHPKDGMIPPDRFIKILEQTGLISRLDRYMWEAACQHLRRWSEMGFRKSYISINISQKDFYLLDVYEVITSLVKQYEIAPKRLHLEITETAVMDNKEHLKLISKLRKYGFIVEIDDFGSGYSSLNMLKELEADVLKIDMGFLQRTGNSGNSEKSKIILQMIIKLAKSLDMEVITEGVEFKEQVLFLAEYGCDIYQGYYFAKPMTVSDFESDYLNKRFRMK
ncbi:MAG: EAL domain-containing protein [Ruminococcus sp.]|nr:EAL domain-containing protein [Ruminococcus sp.]